MISKIVKVFFLRILGVAKVSSPKVDYMPNVFAVTKCENSQNFIKINECGNLWESDNFGEIFSKF